MMNITTESLKNGTVLIVADIGKLHESIGSCSQDSYAYCQNGKNDCAFAVADGVSTCQNAKAGSFFAVRTVCDLLGSIENETVTDIKKKIVSFWKKTVASQWNDYGTTLNFVYVFGDKIIVGKIGDGIAMAKLKDNLIFICDDAPFYTNETFALGERVPSSAFEVQEISLDNASFVDVLLMTDGIAKEIDVSLLPEFMQYISGNYLDKKFTKELEHWILELNKKNNDDKTLLFAHIAR